MSDKSDAIRVDAGQALVGFIGLLAKAVLSGIAASVVFALLALGLATTAGAQSIPDDAKTGTLLFRTGAEGGFAPAPKVETDVAIHVTGIAARTRVVQTFHNPGAEWVEGVYLFPLPESAAVDRLWLRIGERVIEGQVKQNEAARRVDADARREGRKGAPVEQRRPNLLNSAAVNVGPGEYVRVLIEYRQSLAIDKGEYRLRFPLAFTPRYEPAGNAIVDEPRTAQPLLEGGAASLMTTDTGSIPFVLHPDYAPASDVNPVAIALVIDLGVPLATVTSSYHDVWIEKESGTRTAVYFQREQEEADRDFELVWTPQASPAPQAAVSTASGGGTGDSLLLVRPPQTSPAERAVPALIPRETIFVVDTSGSMKGTSMRQAKQSLLAGVAATHPVLREAIVVSGRLGNQPWSEVLTPSTGLEPTGVGTLWAKAKIASLTDERHLGVDEALIRLAVVEVALEQHVVSRYTSLVAVEATPAAPAGETKLYLAKASSLHAAIDGELPQTDAAATGRVALGLLALAAAGMVTLLGCSIPAGGAPRGRGARRGALRQFSVSIPNGP